MYERVNPSHPDKIADRIAGALVDLAYASQENPRIAVEVLLGHGVCHIIAETSAHLTDGRTCQAHSPQAKARTSKPSSRRSALSKKIRQIFLDLRSGRTPEKSWQIITQSHGGYLTRSTGESPSEENASSLSQILQANVPEKYYLSPNACQGILRRASKRDKELPEVLRLALERQASA